MIRLIFIALMVGLTACSSTPTVFNTELEGSPNISIVMADEADSFAGQRVRWGGEIIAVRNQPEESWIEVLYRPLTSSGRPNLEQSSEGRFFVKMTGFIEPQDYQEGRMITAVGQLAGFINQKVGEFDYRYPVLEVDRAEHKLWTERSKASHWNVRPSLYWDWPWHYSPYRGSLGTRVILIKDSENQ